MRMRACLDSHCSVSALLELQTLALLERWQQSSVECSYSSHCSLSVGRRHVKGPETPTRVDLLALWSVWGSTSEKSGRPGLTSRSGTFPLTLLPVLAVLLTLSAAADVAGSRWLTLYGFPGLSEGDADGSHLTMVCPIRDSVP